jgi:hypothetical protein
VTDDEKMAELAAQARARAAATEDPEERARLEEAAAAYDGHAIPPSGALIEVAPIPIQSDACPACGTPGGRYVTHVCMTAGIPSHDPASEAPE